MPSGQPRHLPPDCRNRLSADGPSCGGPEWQRLSDGSELFGEFRSVQLFSGPEFFEGCWRSRCSNAWGDLFDLGVQLSNEVNDLACHGELTVTMISGTNSMSRPKLGPRIVDRTLLMCLQRSRSRSRCLQWLRLGREQSEGHLASGGWVTWVFGCNCHREGE